MVVVRASIVIVVSNRLIFVFLSFVLCKDSANERHENLFSDGRVQPILCKVTAFLPTIAFRSGVKMRCAPVFHLNI